jgi:uncharacterized membrane protein YphA (DoxX/SURF4 family)
VKAVGRPLFLLGSAAVASLFFAGVCQAHERFIRHTLLHPVNAAFFRRDPDGVLGINRNIAAIGAHAAALIAAFLLLWFLRERLSTLVQSRALGFLRGRPQRLVHLVSCYLTDRPVKSRVFHGLGQWAVILFMRSPGLVLMYSAANDSLVMPSYPLDPASASFFKFAQVALAILILTQTLLPLAGAILFGTWIYLNRWGWIVAVDAIPIWTAAVVYVTSPWQSHTIAITEFNATQLRWLRLTLGFGFFLLGWLKIYNYNLVAGVADNYPSVMDDPMVKLLAFGTDPRFARESWIVSFGMAEVMSGFLLMTGVFTRIWSTIMLFVFTKLMLVDFGWEEIPHIYPIGAMAALIFSNKHSSEFQRIEEIGDRMGRQGRVKQEIAMIGAPALGTAFVIVFAALFFLGFLDRSSL